MNERSLADDQGKATGLVEAGRQLAEARAAVGLTQNQLASQLHLGEEQLAALERGDQAELPEPVFIKAMVRRISSHLGLDADAMVQTLGPLTTRPPKRATPPTPALVAGSVEVLPLAINCAPRVKSPLFRVRKERALAPCRFTITLEPKLMLSAVKVQTL